MSSRPQRADARTNRVRILEVADEVFGRGGESASTEEVARVAGVGIATVFRHFPTKAALLEAVLVWRFDGLRDQAAALLEAGGDGDGAAAAASNGLRRAVAALLHRAQRAGAVRDDVELPEVYALLVATSRTAGGLDEEVRDRVLAIVFDGLAPLPR